MDALDKQIVRQVTKGLTIAEIDAATDAQLFCELERLFLGESGGKVEFTQQDPDAHYNGHSITLFTCQTQHVTGNDFRLVIKRALVLEMFRLEHHWPHPGDLDAWAAKHKVPSHLWE